MSEIALEAEALRETHLSVNSTQFLVKEVTFPYCIVLDNELFLPFHVHN
jgi:hypothetical protein